MIDAEICQDLRARGYLDSELVELLVTRLDEAVEDASLLQRANDRAVEALEEIKDSLDNLTAVLEGED